MSVKSHPVLVIEDTPSLALVYGNWLKKRGLASVTAETAAAGLDHIRSGSVQVVLLDLQLPDMSGQDVLRAIASEQLPVTVVVVTSSSSINTAVEAMRLGAYDFLAKPASEERLVTTIRNALERQKLQKAVVDIRSRSGNGSNHGFVGSSLAMVGIYRMIEQVARSNASVFITGESGTGKEVCAQAIHNSSPRRAGGFVALNCAAIPKDLMESELFGHVRGAFTGATTDRDGAALSANGGTLFLDEICEMDLNLQSKLLRFLQTGSIQKVGSDRVQKVDVRVLCATNRDPMTEVEEARFREDLYYRLHVVPIHLPPLRDRDGDALEIARSMLEVANAEEGKDFDGFSECAENLLLTHSWPGNVRELQNVVRKAVILNDGEVLDAEMLDLPHQGSQPDRRGKMIPISSRQAAGSSMSLVVDLERRYELIEREIIEAAISACDGSIPRASQMLGLSPSTIYRKRESWDNAA